MMIKEIQKFLGSRFNLNLMQCILYFIIGYVMSIYLDWPKVMLMLGTIIGLQFITRIKAVADGMMFRQIMLDNEWEVGKVIQKIKNEADKARQDKNYN